MLKAVEKSHQFLVELAARAHEAGHMEMTTNLLTAARIVASVAEESVPVLANAYFFSATYTLDTLSKRSDSIARREYQNLGASIRKDARELLARKVEELKDEDIPFFVFVNKGCGQALGLVPLGISTYPQIGQIGINTSQVYTSYDKKDDIIAEIRKVL